jgi:uncharacterized protein YgbK (DUF1537 family)
MAGDSRAMSPEEMDEHLPEMFSALASCGAPIIHYKVCSTFDSSAAIGSIGRATEIGRRVFDARWVPIIGATPGLQRYCIFGHLFARSGTDGQIYRLDRHPIMRVHPVTPMNESDLSLHLGRQTVIPFGRLDLAHLDAGMDATRAELDRVVETGAGAVIFDGATQAHMKMIGALLDERSRERGGLFVVGPSGVEHALTAWWRESGQINAALPDYDRLDPASTVLALSGSASRLSALQVDAAIAAGFAEIAVDSAAIVDDKRWDAIADALVSDAVALLKRGERVMMHTSRGPDDKRIRSTIDYLRSQGWSEERARHEGGRLLGQRLGSVVRRILDASSVGRLLLSGGDTSSQVTKVLAPDGLVIAARLAKGAPLCRFISSDPRLDGLEVALKGGQMGDADFFVLASSGTP